MNYTHLHLHQSPRLRNLNLFEPGLDFFDRAYDRARLRRDAEDRYVPEHWRLLEDVRRSEGKLRVRVWISGLMLDLAEECCPAMVDSLHALDETGGVDWSAGSYYHSFAFLYSQPELDDQVELHTRRIQGLFGRAPLDARPDVAPAAGGAAAPPFRPRGPHGVLASDALRVAFAMRDQILASRDPGLVHTWRTLQCRDYYTGMDDVSIHPAVGQESPYEGYVRLMTALDKLARCVKGS